MLADCWCNAKFLLFFLCCVCVCVLMWVDHSALQIVLGFNWQDVWHLVWFDLVFCASNGTGVDSLIPVQDCLDISLSIHLKKITIVIFFKVTITETGWDLGPSAAVLQCLYLDTPLLQQQNTKKLYGTKNNCVHGAAGANSGPKRYKETKNSNCHF